MNIDRLRWTVERIEPACFARHLPLNRAILRIVQEGEEDEEPNFLCDSFDEGGGNDEQDPEHSAATTLSQLLVSGGIAIWKFRELGIRDLDISENLI